MTPEEALDLIRAAGQVTVTLDDLAKQWGTSPATARKRLQRWEERGQVVCAWTGTGSVTVSTPPVQSGVDTGKACPLDSLDIPHGHFGQVNQDKGLRRLPSPFGQARRGVDRALTRYFGQATKPPVQTVDRVDTPLDRVDRVTEADLSKADDAESNVVQFRSARGSSNLAEAIQARAEELKAELQDAVPAAAPALKPAPYEPRSPGLITIGGGALVIALWQSTKGAAEYAKTPEEFFLMAGMAFVVGLGAAVLLYKGLAAAGWNRRITLVLCALACLTANLWGGIGFTLSRVQQVAAEGQASHETRVRAEADLSRLRDRQKLLDQEAITARTEKGCGTPVQCRARGEKLAKEAAAFAPQIREAESALEKLKPRAAADPKSAAIARLLSIAPTTAATIWSVGIASLLEILAAVCLGYGLGRRA